MTCWPVSARVGNVKNNDPSLIESLLAVPSVDKGLSDAKLFNCLPVDIDAEARSVRNVDPAGSLYDRLLDNRHSQRVLRLIELQQWLDGVQRVGSADRIAAPCSSLL